MSVFDQTFQSVETGVYATGKLFGEIGDWLEVPPAFTGEGILRLSRHRLYKPEVDADRGWQGSFLGQQAFSIFDYGQAVQVEGPVTSTDHGIECRIPSGEFPDTAQFRCDLWIPDGTGISVYVSGAQGSTGFVLGDHFREFRPLAFEVYGPSTDEVRVGLVAQPESGEQVRFVIDNVSLRPVSTSYLQATGVPDQLHQVGIVGR